MDLGKIEWWGQYNGLGCSASNGIGSRPVTTDLGSILDVSAEGVTVQKKPTNAGIIEFDVSLNAVGAANGLTHQARTFVGSDILVAITDRAIELVSNFETSYRRGPGGVSIANVPANASEAIRRLDIGLDNLWTIDQDEFYGVVSFTIARYLRGLWSDDIYNEWIESIYGTTWSDGLISEITSVDFAYDFNDAAVRALKNGPRVVQVTYTGTDQKYGFSAIASANVFIHVPLEDTGQTWSASEEGSLPQILPLAYQNTNACYVVNDSETPLSTTLTIQQSYTASTTDQISLSGGASIAIEAVLVNFGLNRSWSSTDQESLSIGASFPIIVAPHTTKKLVLFPCGTVNYPVLSVFSRNGFSGDTNNFWYVDRQNVSWGYSIVEVP